MTTHTDEEPQVKSWERFFKTYHGSDPREGRAPLAEAVLGWPKRRSFEVRFHDLENHDGNLAQFLLDHPYEALAHAHEALKSVDVPGLDLVPIPNGRARLQVRVTRLNSEKGEDHPHSLKIRDLRSDQLGKLVSVTGRVVRIRERVKPQLVEAVFICSRCGNAVRMPQDEHRVLQEPVECYEDQGGCGKEAKFKLLTGRAHRGASSVTVDAQDIQIEELVGSVPDQPQRIIVALEDDLCGEVAAGAVVTIVGVLRSQVDRKGNVKSTLLDTFLEANSVRRATDVSPDALPNKAELNEIERLAKSATLYDDWIASIAPSIFGMQYVKLAALLQLFGGVRKTLPDKMTLRGDIHILLVGDPGVAKSQLMRWLQKNASPRAEVVTGKGASSAGLTAAATRDDFDGRWTLEAGAMPRMDRGHLYVDEIDKMDANDQVSMHEAMEQQTITVSKAGINGTFPARTSVMAAANPKEGRLNPDRDVPVRDQTDFPPPLLSRFDLIFVLRDEPDPAHDRDLMGHILDRHMQGARIANDEPRLEREDEDPPVPKELLRKWIVYARENIHPQLTSEARTLIHNYYVKIRNPSALKGGPVSITARQGESVIRLAEASARVRLSKDVTIEDANRAIELYEIYMDQVCRGKDGQLDVDRQVASSSHTDREMHIVLETIRYLQRAPETHLAHGPTETAIADECERRGLHRLEALRWLAELSTRKDGPIWSPHTGHYKTKSRGKKA